MKNDFLQSYDYQADADKKFPKIWANLLAEHCVSSQNTPVGVLLGGQPGAGKSFGAEKISSRLNHNVLIINGDEFRAYHQYYDEIGHFFEDTFAEKTQPFANEIVNRVKQKAFELKFNIIIEGTFRTTETPLKELANLKQDGYQTGIIICTCPKELSWQSTIKHAETQRAKGLVARYVPKAHHQLVVDCLAKNVEQVYTMGQPDFLEIYSRTTILFDSKRDDIRNIFQVIQQELNRNAI